MHVAANGTTLYVEQAGAGTPLVFVHGMCGDARVWSDQVDRLSAAHTCVTYDRRGHTRSPEGDAPLTVALHADDLAGLIEGLDLDRPVVVGSSGGARVSLDCIRRYPGLVRGAVLSEPPIGALAPDLFPGMIGEVAPAVEKAAGDEGPRAAVDAFFAILCPGLWADIDESVRDRYRDNAPALFGDLTMPPYVVSKDDIAKIDVPTLVVTGAHSHPALRTGAHNLADWLPHAQLTELDCGHVTYAEQPAAFADAVAEFARAR